jgi:hypothetical protein
VGIIRNSNTKCRVTDCKSRWYIQLPLGFKGSIPVQRVLSLSICTVALARALQGAVSRLNFLTNGPCQRNKGTSQLTRGKGAVAYQRLGSSYWGLGNDSCGLFSRRLCVGLPSDRFPRFSTILTMRSPSCYAPSSSQNLFFITISTHVHIVARKVCQTALILIYLKY